VTGPTVGSLLRAARRRLRSIPDWARWRSLLVVVMLAFLAYHAHHGDAWNALLFGVTGCALSASMGARLGSESLAHQIRARMDAEERTHRAISRHLAARAPRQEQDHLN